eukprot:scaffold46380_cov57-Phaeocystis_antarctica.AAC.1
MGPANLEINPSCLRLRQSNSGTTLQIPQCNSLKINVVVVHFFLLLRGRRPMRMLGVTVDGLRPSTVLATPEART